MGNRFEKVDSVQKDAMTLELSKQGDVAMGVVHWPATLSSHPLPKDFQTSLAPAKDAFRNAVKLANDRKAALVVIDNDNVWDAAWGELFVYEDEEDGEAGPAN
jgi:hypothetical protein